MYGVHFTDIRTVLQTCTRNITDGYTLFARSPAEHFLSYVLSNMVCGGGVVHGACRRLARAADVKYRALDDVRYICIACTMQQESSFVYVSVLVCSRARTFVCLMSTP